MQSQSVFGHLVDLSSQQTANDHSTRPIWQTLKRKSQFAISKRHGLALLALIAPIAFVTPQLSVVPDIINRAINSDVPTSTLSQVLSKQTLTVATVRAPNTYFGEDGFEHGFGLDVMQGYATIAAEAIEASAASGQAAYTHVLLQGGVGGLAAGVAAYWWEHAGAARPTFIVVEPEQADCLWQSAVHGQASVAQGSVDSIMAGLACGATSPLAWRFLDSSVDAFMTVSDDEAITAMRQLAAGSERDIPVLAGESGVAGLAALNQLAANKQQMAVLGLDEHARVLFISSEGATAPSVYAEAVGETAESVLARQQQWLAGQTA